MRRAFVAMLCAIVMRGPQDGTVSDTDRFITFADPATITKSGDTAAMWICSITARSARSKATAISRKTGKRIRLQESAHASARDVPALGMMGSMKRYSTARHRIRGRASILARLTYALLVYRASGGKH